MKTKGKDRMTEFNLKLELKTFKNKTGDDFLFVKTDGSYFAFKKVVAKQAIGRGLGMDQDKIRSLTTRQIGDRFWSGGEGARKADSMAAPAH